MKKWLEEIKRIQNEANPMLDRKCIGIDSNTIVFLDTFEMMNLTNNYFESQKSVLDPTWAGCYIKPGEISTLREVHINAVKSDAISHIMEEWYRCGYYKCDYKEVPEDFKNKCDQFFLEII